MEDFWLACRKGFKMSKRSVFKTLNVILLIAALGALLTSPWSLPQIESVAWRIFLWILIIAFGIGVAVSIGLMPYFGQKEITKEKENWGNGLVKDLQEGRDKNEKLEARIKDLESKL